MHDDPNPQSLQDAVRRQFGRAAEGYVTSPVHAKGWTLERIVTLVQPQSSWHALDIATGGGHTALAFAPHVARVVATDLTPEMLRVAADLAVVRQVENVEFRDAAAESLPFADNTFDLVTCRIAPHHFADVSAFLTESHRVLKPSGTLAIVDNIVPPGATGDYVNAFEALRDPSHAACLSAELWQQELFAAGFALRTVETGFIEMAFEPWVARMHVADADVVRLRAMLLQAPDAVTEHLQPRVVDGSLRFSLQRIILIAGLRP